MRVITGAARGRKLGSVEGPDTRPTADRIKESMFNIIQFDIEGRRILDLFAGTGQLGIEALSRGAREGVFVDFASAAADTIRANLKVTGFERRAKVVQTDYQTFLRAERGKFDLIFADPPYNTDFGWNAVCLALSFDILSEGGIIVVETTSDSVFSKEGELPEGVSSREYVYGKKKLSVFRKECRI